MPYSEVECFWLEFTGQVQVGLRRYVRSNGQGWTCEEGWHSALAVLGVAPAVLDADGYIMGGEYEYPDHDDVRWPAQCDKCDYRFVEQDRWQEWFNGLYRRTDTGQVCTLRDAPPGAMWDAWWYSWKGPDGRSLVVKCPNGHEWCIDSRASNCTLPHDKEHRCWVRHGEPPRISVDKSGLTCQAGAGSIVAGDYHGFLVNGRFTPG